MLEYHIIIIGLENEQSFLSETERFMTKIGTVQCVGTELPRRALNSAAGIERAANCLMNW